MANTVENNKRFDIQIAGERICIPVDAKYNIEHDKKTTLSMSVTNKGQEIEFQIK